MSSSPPFEVSSVDSCTSIPNHSARKNFDEENAEEAQDCIIDEEKTLGNIKVESMSKIKSKIHSMANLPPISDSASAILKRRNQGPHPLKGYHSGPTSRLAASSSSAEDLEASGSSGTSDEACSSKPQLDKIFTCSDRFGSSSSHVATDFSRALLANLLKRGKEQSLEFETSQAGTFSNALPAEERRDAVAASSVEELALKIVNRINQVQYGLSNTYAKFAFWSTDV